VFDSGRLGVAAMSLINQVLNDLEKRGSEVDTDQIAIRVVPKQSRGLRAGVAFLLGAVLILVVAGIIIFLRDKISVPMKAQLPAQVVTDLPVIYQPQPASAILATQEGSEPASLLSFELSRIPEPISAHDKRAHTLIAKEQQVSRVPGTKAMTPSSGRPVPVETKTNHSEPIKRVSPQQQAEDEFNQAMTLIQTGRSGEALPHLEATLHLNPMQVQARQALAALFMEGKRNDDAEHLLQEGLNLDIRQVGFAMLLARLQVERGAIAQAQETLKKSSPYADRDADYQAFVAAMLQRQERHVEAIARYQAALQLSPNTGVWLVGLGISMQATKRTAEARDAYQRAIGTHSLSADLQDFVERRLKEL
jgi:MSHA biogenesis protein MshN